MKQRTIANVVSIEGVGLHSGAHVTLSLNPAEENHGYKFQRIDLPDSPVIIPDVAQVVSTNRGTTIRSGEVQVATVEHLLSALSGMGIDNILVKLNGPEIPILDGSALPFVTLIEEAGILEQKEERKIFELKETVRFFDEETGTELMAMPSEKFEITTLIDFNSPVVGPQYAQLTDMNDYAREIAPCRTFVFVHELEQLMDQGLIKGGDIDNAVVIANQPVSDEELSRLAKKLGKEEVRIDREGIVSTTDLRFQNEPARHKLLDVIGDLTLLGNRIKARIVANKPGHKANVEFAKLLKKKLLEDRKLKGKPIYNPDIEPVMTTEDIKAMLPHRYPFLLVDKVIKLEDNMVVGVKNVTGDESFFQGHFPDDPVFPGVLQIEAMAQTGGILALSNVEDPDNWSTYFIKIDNAKFKHKVVPGDTLILKLELLSPIRRGICQMQGTAYVGNKIVSEGELTAQIFKRS